jgi:hypothetical protein
MPARSRNNYEETTLNLKPFIAAFAVIIAVVLAVLISSVFLHSNSVQNFQVIQSVTGSVDVRSDGGYYFRFFPRIWTYPKVSTVFFSNEKAESKDNDGVTVRFVNKGEGDVSCQVVYRLYTDADTIKRMHTYAGGDIDIIDNLVLSKLKDIAMTCASNITSHIRELFVNNKELLEAGIQVEQFSITKINFDTVTTDLFQAQQKADLQKKTAEAEKQNLIMQKERTEAQYEQQIAESKGKAEVEKIKAVTDAERQKELAEIAAKQEVAVAELEKQRASVEANKKLEVAEIQRKEEEQRLQIIQIQAEQKIAAAKAKEQEIKLSGAITEAEKTRLEIDKATKIGVAEAWARGVAQMKLPATLMVGNGAADKGSPVDALIQLMTVEKAKELNK